MFKSFYQLKHLRARSLKTPFWKDIWKDQWVWKQYRRDYKASNIKRGLQHCSWSTKREACSTVSLPLHPCVSTLNFFHKKLFHELLATLFMQRSRLTLSWQLGYVLHSQGTPFDLFRTFWLLVEMNKWM